MKKYLLPSALILVLGLGFAVAQNINRAVQLSQDTTGAFSVDSNFGMYFPGHIFSPTAISTINPLPTINGSGTPTIAGTDTAGSITFGTAATAASAIFGRAYLYTPNCFAQVQSSTGVAIAPTAISILVTTTGINLFQLSAASDRVGYFCIGASG